MPEPLAGGDVPRAASRSAEAPRSGASALLRRGRNGLGIVVSVACVAAVVLWISHQERPTLPSTWTGLAWLAGAVACYAVGMAGRGWRWHRIMVLADIPHARADAMALTVVGYMGNNVLPARGGEVLRIAILGSRTTARKREILGSVLAERLLDVAILAALFVPLTWAGVAGAPAGQLPAVVAGIALALGGVALAAYLHLRRRGRFERLAERIRPVARASKIFARREGMALAALSAAVWALEGFGLLVIGRSLGVELAFVDAQLAIVLASLLAAVPAAPGYAGTYDAGLILGLRAAEVTGGLVVGFVLLARTVMFLPVTIAGLILLVARYGGLRAWRQRL
jgi:hypothetical protein